MTAAGERTYRQDYRMVAKDGRVVWFHDESVLDRRRRRRAALWQGIMVDITDQKAAEQRVREAEERHRALVEHIPAIVYAEGLDADPEDLYVSPQVERILGYTPDQWRSDGGLLEAARAPRRPRRRRSRSTTG